MCSYLIYKGCHFLLSIGYVCFTRQITYIGNNIIKPSEYSKNQTKKNGGDKGKACSKDKNPITFYGHVIKSLYTGALEHQHVLVRSH